MSFRVMALFGLFMFIMTAIGVAIGGILGSLAMIFLFGSAFFIASLATSLVTHWRAPQMILGRYNAKESDNEKLNGIVERMAMNAKIPKPKVYILPIDVPNSFSTGVGREKAAICVTEGILSMNKGEIEGIVSHEAWHIYNNDIIIQSVTSMLAHILYSTVVLSPVAVLLKKMAISELREYRADYYGSRFSKKTKDLAAAIGKINEIARHNPLHSSPAFECIWMVSPFRREGVEGMFSTHPPSARRIKRLEEMEHEGIPEPPVVTEVDDI